MNSGNDVDNTTKNIFSVDSTKKKIFSVDSTKNMFPVLKLYDDILEELKCPICKDYWKKESIEMCKEGHNICNRCQEHISPNAGCTAPPSGVQNVVLENIVKTAIYMCPFAKSREAPCAWSGIPFDIQSHVKCLHDSVTVTGNGESEWIRLSLVPPFKKAIFTLDKLFFPVTSIMEGKLRFSVFHVGHNDESTSFRYDFRIQKSDNPEESRNELGGICHNYQKKRNEVEEYRECVTLYPDSIEKYRTDKHTVSCDIKIRRTVTNEDVEMKETTENTTQPPVNSEYIPADKYFM